ncbi:RecX family transcriptional regulator [Candidatus Saccharibacteria bacterium]|nr:RecX family transcriptional regulator [Candidatus Saccharibacteria bacterium]
MEILRNNNVVEKTTLQQADQIVTFEITDLRPAVKNENRVNVYINEKFAFSLDLTQVVDFKLKRGQKITPAELSKYQKASNFGKLYQRTLEWVLSRPHSVRETKDYLNKKKYQKPEYEISDEDIAAVIARLIDKRYLDDAKFAEYYIENRFQKKGISSKRLRLELTKKGIAPEQIEIAFAKIGRNDEEEIKKIINKKRARYDDDKLINYLVRQGFDFELARNCVRETD